MKTLYVDINNEHIKSTNDLIVCQYDYLLSDFYFYLGSKIAEDCVVKSKTELITEFSTTDYKDEFKLITTQWNDLKRVLFGETVDGIFSFTIPEKFIHWLRLHPQYNSVYYKKFSHKQSNIITIDIKELYDEVVKDLLGYILCELKRNNLYLEIDKIVFNDTAISYNSPIVHAIKKKYNQINFIPFAKYNKNVNQENKAYLFPILPPLNVEIGRTCIFNLKCDNIAPITKMIKSVLEDNNEACFEIGDFKFTVDKDGVFIDCKIKSDSQMPKEWFDNFGWSWAYNINDWVEILHLNNFVIYKINKPNNTFERGCIHAQSPDCKYRVVVNFYKNIASDIYIDCMSDTIKKNNIAIIYKDKKNNILYKNNWAYDESHINKLFPIHGITLGTYHSETEQKYGIFSPASWIEFSLNNGVYRSVTMKRFPKEWEKIGINKYSSIDEVKDLLLKFEFEYNPIEDVEYLELAKLENRQEINFSANITNGRYILSIEYVNNSLNCISISYIEKQTNELNGKEIITWPIDISEISLINMVKLGYTPISIIGHDDTNYILLAFKQNVKCVINSLGHFLYNFEYAHAIPTKTGKFVIVKNLSSESRYFGLINAIDGKELLPPTYYNYGGLHELEAGFFNTKLGEFCALLEAYCEYSDQNIFLDKTHLRLYSKTNSLNYINLKETLLKAGFLENEITYVSWRIDRVKNIYHISAESFPNQLDFLTNKNVDRIYHLHSDEELDSVDDDKIVLKQFDKISSILNCNFNVIYSANIILDSDETIADISEGMTIIMAGNHVTRILDENYNNILKPLFITIEEQVKFQNGFTLFQIDKNQIGCLSKKGKYYIIPYKYGKQIKKMEMLIAEIILITKNNEQSHLINIHGEELLSIGRWDKVRRISDTKFEVYNFSNVKQYEVVDNYIREIK